MAGIKDILETEQKRETVEDCCCIHLFQEGSFYRAYEVSAWLCSLHINQFKVTHRHVKGIDQTIAFVGFPVSSLEKRTPEDATVEGVEDKHLKMVLQKGDEEKEVKDLKNDFAVWKSRQPITESKDDAMSAAASKQPSNQKQSMPTLFSVAQRIMAFPIESNSPIDSMLFLAEIKKDLIKIV